MGLKRPFSAILHGETQTNYLPGRESSEMMRKGPLATFHDSVKGSYLKIHIRISSNLLSESVKVCHTSPLESTWCLQPRRAEVCHHGAVCPAAPPRWRWPQVGQPSRALHKATVPRMPTARLKAGKVFVSHEAWSLATARWVGFG